MKFGELNNWDIFETDGGEYYLKIEPKNGFNSILLTGKEIERHCFNDDTNVIKF